MRYLTRLVLAAALVVTLSAAATVAYAYRLTDPGRDGLALTRIAGQVADARAALRAGGDPAAAADALAKADRELARLETFRQAETVDGLRGAVVFFLLQTLAVVAALAAASSFTARGLAGLRRGIGEARSAGAAYRFKAEGAPDFKEIAGELNRMLETVERQEAELREAATLAGWKEVASFLGHQLKNPLAAVFLAAANAREALDRPEVEPALRERLLAECAVIAADESARMKALVARFRSLASFEAPRFAAADLVGLVRAALDRRGPAYASGRVEGPARLDIRLDAELLSQAFANLVDNAVEAAGGLEGAPPPAGPVRIVVRVLATAAGAAVEFTDSNRGVDPGIVGRLGKERTSTKRTGSGLGLLFVRRIAAIHGGELTAVLTERGGLRFTLTLSRGESA